MQAKGEKERQEKEEQEQKMRDRQRAMDGLYGSTSYHRQAAMQASAGQSPPQLLAAVKSFYADSDLCDLPSSHASCLSSSESSNSLILFYDAFRHAAEVGDLVDLGCAFLMMCNGEK